MVNQPKFKNVAIYSSLREKRVHAIADQIIEVLSQLGINCLAPSSSKIKTKQDINIYTDKTIIKR